MNTTEKDTTEIDRDFARAVRAELAAVGTRGSRLQRMQRRTRTLALTAAALVLAGATTGAAVVLNNLPGATTVTPTGAAVEVTRTGSADIELGIAPPGADAVIVTLTCVSDTGVVSVPTNPQGPGEFEEPGAVEADCALVQRPVHVTDGLLQVGATSIAITADAGTTWTATAQYAGTSTTPWGVNGRGQTYGVPNADGVPDLIAAQGTNGEQGYISFEELTGMHGDGYLDVYESDGATVIGRFPVGDVSPLVE